MPKYVPNMKSPAYFQFRGRRPAGVSRRQKQRCLGFETLEVRQVLSANPISYDYDYSDQVMRELLLDSAAIRSLQHASDLSQYTEAQLAAVTQWVVFAELGTDLSAYETAGGFSVDSPTDIVPASYIVDVTAGNSGQLIDALSNQESIDFFYPLVNIGAETLFVPNDPLVPKQWHLVNYGQEVGNPNFGFLYGTVDEDINIEDAWDFYTGEGVVIGIVDSGTDINHPDLAANIRGDLSIDLVDGGLPLPSGDDAHGTATAGLAAGVGNNGVGITGVAYNADIAPIRLFSDDPLNPSILTDFQISQAFLHQFQQIDIYNHSWGIPHYPDEQGNIDPRSIIELGPLAQLALRNSVFFGRGGLGSIHVFAAGNERGVRDSANYSETANSRYTIAVGAVIEDGTGAAYSEAGPAVLVVAPSGSNPGQIIRDNELGAGIVTTDQVGDRGYNVSGDPITGIEVDSDYLDDNDYTTRFNGTSAATPIVSGVIGLMLEANPNLTYRDVQHILVRSARQNNPEDISWITNLQDFFSDPLNYDSDPDDSIYDGAWPFPVQGTDEVPDKLVRYQVIDSPYLFTNGAGFAVSDYTLNLQEGYAHGVVDAALAVELAKNWVTVGNQQAEFTWTTGGLTSGQVHAASISNDETGGFRVPGGIWRDGDIDDPNPFIDFFDEFSVEDDPAVPDPMADPPEDPDGPFTGDDPPINTRDANGAFSGLPGLVFAPPAMSVEWVEVDINMNGDENAFDFLRISLVSPSGTVSELKTWDIPTVQDPILNDLNFLYASGDPAGVLSPGTEGLHAVFTTNRFWGERSEAQMRLNSDGTPVLQFNPETGEYDGFPVFDNWRLVFENYGDEVLDIANFEIAFHGTTAAGTGRIRGAIGVDDNGDGFFSDSTGTADNFTRYVETELVDPGDDGMIGTEDDLDFRYVGRGDLQFLRTFNADQESWAAGIIVYADLDHNGVRDATDPMYQVGADGNYYFDLVAGLTYDIRIDPTSLEAAGLYNQQNLDFVNGFLVQAEIENAGDQVFGFPASEDAIGFSSVPELNIKLVPNAKPDEIYNLYGYVYGDINENGVRDANDVNIDGAAVYIDANQNGVYSPGVDPFIVTTGGRYEFQDLILPTGFYRVSVLANTTGAFGQPFNPDNGTREFFFDPSPELDNFVFPEVYVSIDSNGIATYETDFGFIPGGEVGNPTGSVAISGVVFDDANGTGTRQSYEHGLAGNVATVYLDLNDNNIYDDGDLGIEPAANGSFNFNNLPQGVYSVRIDFDEEQYTQTTPNGFINQDGTRANEDDWEFTVNLTNGAVASGLLFGLKNNADSDWGDLPSEFYPTTSAQNGPSHLVLGSLFLGAGVDAELDGLPNVAADGDDTNGFDDEDGIQFSTLLDNSTTITLTITANTNGGWLQGWMDFNEDHIFQDSERVFTDELLEAGENVFVINVPSNLTTGTVYARFRYGEEGIASYTGPAQRGEVEDYAIPVVSTAIDTGLLVIHGPDFNEDGSVDGRDFLAWQRGFGSSDATPAQGDANNDKLVDAKDLEIWQADYGSVSTSTTSVISTVIAPEVETSQKGLEVVPLVSNSFGSSTQSLAFTHEASISNSTFGNSTNDPFVSIASEMSARTSTRHDRAQFRVNADSLVKVDAAFEQQAQAISEIPHSSHSRVGRAPVRADFRIDQHEDDMEHESDDGALEIVFASEELWRTV